MKRPEAKSIRWSNKKKSTVMTVFAAAYHKYSPSSSRMVMVVLELLIGELTVNVSVCSTRTSSRMLNEMQSLRSAGEKVAKNWR